MITEPHIIEASFFLSALSIVLYCDEAGQQPLIATQITSIHFSRDYIFLKFKPP